MSPILYGTLSSSNDHLSPILSLNFSLISQVDRYKLVSFLSASIQFFVCTDSGSSKNLNVSTTLAFVPSALTYSSVIKL